MHVKVGLTGNIGSGKSLVASIFMKLGSPVFEADTVAKRFLDEPVIIEAISDELGDDLIDASGKINRQKLASKVFNNAESLDFINHLIHPKVRDEFDRWAALHESAGYVIYVAALIFETGSYKRFDKTILVTAPVDVRLKRVMERDGMTADQVVARMKNQWEEERKVPLADYVVLNDGRHPVLSRCLEIHNDLLNLRPVKIHR